MNAARKLDTGSQPGKGPASRPASLTGVEALAAAKARRDKRKKQKAPKAFLEAAKKHTWKKGQSGNPSGLNGKARSFSQLIRDVTHDGEALIETMYTVAINAPLEENGLPPYGIREQLQAIEYLTAYGFGKPPQEIKLEATNPLVTANMAVLSNEQLLQLSQSLGALKLVESRSQPPALDDGGRGTPLLEGPGREGEALAP